MKPTSTRIPYPILLVYALGLGITTAAIARAALESDQEYTWVAWVFIAFVLNDARKTFRRHESRL